MPNKLTTFFSYILQIIKQPFSKCLTLLKAVINEINEGMIDERYQNGKRYYTGQKGRKDYNRAFKLFASAAENGHAKAQRAIGTMYCLGVGIQRDCKQAFIWLKKAAEQEAAKKALEILKADE